MEARLTVTYGRSGKSLRCWMQPIKKARLGRIEPVHLLGLLAASFMLLLCALWDIEAFWGIRAHGLQFFGLAHPTMALTAATFATLVLILSFKCDWLWQSFKAGIAGASLEILKIDRYQNLELLS
jgi:hypothetical protein